jgi:hypothetical protein
MLMNGADPAGQSYSQLQSVVFGQRGGSGLGVAGVNSQMKSLADALLQVSQVPAQSQPYVCLF